MKNVKVWIGKVRPCECGLIPKAQKNSVYWWMECNNQTSNGRCNHQTTELKISESEAINAWNNKEFI